MALLIVDAYLYMHPGDGLRCKVQVCFVITDFFVLPFSDWVLSMGKYKHYLLTFQILTFGFLAVALWCVGSLVRLVREGNSAGYNNLENIDQRLVNHQLIDLFFVVFGFALLFGGYVDAVDFLVSTRPPTCQLVAGLSRP